MNRRTFVMAMGAVLVAPAQAMTPAQAGAQGIAVLIGGTPAQFAARRQALERALKTKVRVFAADGDVTRLAALAKEAVASAPAVLVADSMSSGRALFEATAGIPIVLARSENPVAARLVRSLEAPGGNVTGIVSGRPDEILKSAQHLDRLLARGAPLAVVANQNNQTYRAIRARVNHAAKEQKRPQLLLDANRPAEIEAAFAELARNKGAGLLVMDDPMYLDEAKRFVALAAKLRRPVIYPDRAFVRAGGLASYGPDADALMEATAAMVRKVLDGNPAAQLAMQEAPPYTLAVNREAARAQGIRLPAGFA